MCTVQCKKSKENHQLSGNSKRGSTCGMGLKQNTVQGIETIVCFLLENTNFELKYKVGTDANWLYSSTIKSTNPHIQPELPQSVG